MVKEIDVTDIRGRKHKTKAFTTRQEADDILDTLHGFKNKGNGWWGDTPGHRKAALKAERKGAINEPIGTKTQSELYKPYFLKVTRAEADEDILFFIEILSDEFRKENGNKKFLVGYFSEVYRQSKDVSILKFDPYSVDVGFKKKETMYATREQALSAAIKLFGANGWQAKQINFEG